MSDQIITNEAPGLEVEAKLMPRDLDLKSPGEYLLGLMLKFFGSNTEWVPLSSSKGFPVLYLWQLTQEAWGYIDEKTAYQHLMVAIHPDGSRLINQKETLFSRGAENSSEQILFRPEDKSLASQWLLPDDFSAAWETMLKKHPDIRLLGTYQRTKSEVKIVSPCGRWFKLNADYSTSKARVPLFQVEIEYKATPKGARTSQTSMMTEMSELITHVLTLFPELEVNNLTKLEWLVDSRFKST